MGNSILQQISSLSVLNLAALTEKYAELFDGEKPHSANIEHIRRKIAYRLQELASGTLPDEAKNGLNEFIAAYDPINNKALRQNGADPASKGRVRDARLPIPGTVISKVYKGTIIDVKVLDKGFEYAGTPYRSLSSIAKTVTGQHWNGYLFFGL